MLRVDLAVAADFMVEAGAGSTAEAAGGSMVGVEAFTAEEVSMAEDTRRQPQVMELHTLHHPHRCVQGADTRPGRVIAIHIIHVPAAVSPVETSDTEVLPLLRGLLPMADGTRFPVKVGIAARQARNRKQRPRQLQADCTSLTAAAEPDLPARVEISPAKATKSGKTPPPLVT